MDNSVENLKFVSQIELRSYDFYKILYYFLTILKFVL